MIIDGEEAIVVDFVDKNYINTPLKHFAIFAQDNIIYRITWWTKIDSDLINISKDYDK